MKSSVFVMEYRETMIKANAAIALTATEYTMPRGIFIRAFAVSSAMCARPSEPLIR